MACRRSLVQPEMRPIIVVITNIILHQPSGMSFHQHNTMIWSSRFRRHLSAKDFINGQFALTRDHARVTAVQAALNC